MRIPTDPESVNLMRAMKPFLSDRGQYAVDDLLGAVNLVSIFGSLGDAMKRRQGGGGRPLAFLSSLANLDIDPTTVAKAVDAMVNFPKNMPSDSNRSSPGASHVPSGPGGAGGAQPPKPEEIAKIMQSIMNRAATDPNFAALLGSFAEEGMKSSMFPKLMEVMGPEMRSNPPESES